MKVWVVVQSGLRLVPHCKGLALQLKLWHATYSSHSVEILKLIAQKTVIII